MRKKILVICMAVIAAFAMASCGSSEPKVIEENESANKDYIKAAVAAMDGETLALQDKLSWGMSYSDIKAKVKEPYIDDRGDYVTKAFFAGLPADSEWIDAEENIQKEHFISTDILSYYVIDSSIGLYEYGYMAADPNLYQYDFLKSYYTKKYGEPGREDWEFKDESLADGAEDSEKYLFFEEGYVRVMTVWDIEELDSVLVIDWLREPDRYENNYGQVSFYKRSEDFSIDGEGK